MYWSGAGPGEEFFRDRTSIEKYCVEANIVLPRWVWACEPIGFLLNAEEILASARDRTQHDIRYLIEDLEVEELQNVLDDWAMKQGLQSYDVDYTTSVLLDRSLYESVSNARPPKDE